MLRSDKLVQVTSRQVFLRDQNCGRFVPLFCLLNESFQSQVFLLNLLVDVLFVDRFELGHEEYGVHVFSEL